MHLAYIWIVSHLSAKNYRNLWKFDKVLTKTNLLSFFWDTVYMQPFEEYSVYRIKGMVLVRSDLTATLETVTCERVFRSYPTTSMSVSGS